VARRESGKLPAGISEPIRGAAAVSDNPRGDLILENS
jgi:hypothetical protein